MSAAVCDSSCPGEVVSWFSVMVFQEGVKRSSRL